MFMKIQWWDAKECLICPEVQLDLETKIDNKLLQSNIDSTSSMVLTLRVLEIHVKIHNSFKVETIELVKGSHKLKELEQQI